MSKFYLYYLLFFKKFWILWISLVFCASRKLITDNLMAALNNDVHNVCTEINLILEN